MSVFAADRDQLHAMTTPALGIWVSLPTRLRSAVDLTEVPGGLRAGCTKDHAGTHRREIDSRRSPRGFGGIGGSEGRFPVSKILLWPDSD